ncbi:MAG: phosphohistidine phosphatase SixA [Ignavibacteria bacterium]|jgi:phosphohistidine phosphatase
MIDIYIIRHGAAVDFEHEIVEEGFRYLSHKGRTKTDEVAAKLKNLHIQFDLILSSPLVRAVQTAEIFASALKYKGEVKTAIELIGGSTFSRFQQLLKRNQHGKSIAIVCHAPDVNHYAVNLLKHSDIKDLKVNFSNSSVCRIRYDRKNEIGKFIWFLKSDTMELIEP